MSKECPVDHSNFIKKTSSSKKSAETSGDTGSAVSQCPVDHAGSKEIGLNPLNMIPHLPQTMAAGQIKPLSLERTESTIPKNSEGNTWEYPSPQVVQTLICSTFKGHLKT